MKKILVLLVFGSFLFATRYPVIVEYNYLKGCIGNNEKLQNYCICTLNAMENRYTLNEFIIALRDKKKSKELIDYALDECENKLKK